MNILKEFRDGHERFKRLKFRENEERFKRLVEEGQNPKALFIGCSDSRVMPAMITGCGPGDLFIVRNIGNFVPPFEPDNDFHSTAAAIEYASTVLEVSDIVICGHSDCGAIKACFQEHHATQENIHTVKWLQLGMKARDMSIEALPDSTLDERREFAEKISVLTQLDNIMSYPAVRRRVENGTLFLHGWYYDLREGQIYYYDESATQFKKMGE